MESEGGEMMNKEDQIPKAAYNTAMWYKATYLQALRLSEADNRMRNEAAVEEDPFKLPWEKRDTLAFNVERFFFIHAMFHFLDGIQQLNAMLIESGDERLLSIKKRMLDEGNFYQQIRVLRNINEHDIEHMTGKGHFQKHFEKELDTGGGILTTNMHMTVQLGSQVFIGGDIDLLQSLKWMRSFRDELLPILKTLCYGTKSLDDDGKRTPEGS